MNIPQLDDEIVHHYRVSRNAFLRGDMAEAVRFYRRNRTEHCVELFYEVDLPKQLKFVHPIGCVLGRATYKGALVCYQGVGVGSTLDGYRPELGDGVVLFPGAKVLGGAVIGNNVFITANTVVQNRTIPDNSIVIGAEIVSTTRSVKGHYFPENQDV